MKWIDRLTLHFVVVVTQKLNIKKDIFDVVLARKFLFLIVVVAPLPDWLSTFKSCLWLAVYVWIRHAAVLVCDWLATFREKIYVPIGSLRSHQSLRWVYGESTLSLRSIALP